MKDRNPYDERDVIGGNWHGVGIPGKVGTKQEREGSPYAMPPEPKTIKGSPETNILKI